MRPFEFIGGPLDGMTCGLRIEGTVDVPAEWIPIEEAGHMGPVGFVRKEAEGGYQLENRTGELPLRMLWRP